MEFPISRIFVQRLCNERADLVPYLGRIVDSLERNRGLYRTTLTEVVPPDVIDELEEWLSQGQNTEGRIVAENAGLHLGLESLERILV